MKIEVNNLTKKYGKKSALDHITLNLNGPKIYGLLGRNGAGKTTFMEIIAGHILATHGEIRIDGVNPFDNREVTKKICLIQEGDNFSKDFKIKQVLHAYALFYPTWDYKLAKELVETFHLDLNVKVKSLSKGMVSALGIIVGLSTKADITIFDEPYIGLDAAARKKFYEILLEEYENERRTIIFSTHLIDEASLLFEEVLIFQEGNLILQQETDDLRIKTCAISGTASEVEAFIQDKKVIKKDKLAGMMTAYIYCDRKEAKQAGFTVEGIPIQELMIYLTESEGA